MAKLRDASESPRICSSVLTFSTATVGSTARSSRWTAAITDRGSPAVRTTRSFENARRLPERQIDLRLRRARQIVGAAVGHDADDFRRRLLRVRASRASCRSRLAPAKYRSASD